MTQVDKWMGELGPLLGKKTLREIIIPGTHDAGTSVITENSDWAPSSDALLHALPKRRVADWSKAQGWTVHQQLMNGIRYLDLRVAKHDDGRFYFAHTLLGDYVEERIRDIKSFLSRSPQEVVILDFQHFYNMGSVDHVRLARILKYAFGKKLVAPPPKGSSLPKLEALWEEEKQVVVLYGQEGQSQAAFNTTPELWKRDRIQSFWCETSDVGKLRSCLQREVDHPPSREILFVLQGVLTPGSIGDLVSGSLQEWAMSHNGEITSWFSGAWAHRNLNILIVDWVQYGNVVGKAIQLNRAAIPDT
jgi:hypothetical protein